MPFRAGAIAARAVIGHSSQSIARLRRTGGGYTDGLWVPGEVASTTVAASVQPARGRDLERLPENQRLAETIRILTTTELRVADPATGLEGDDVTYRGRRYTVVSVQDREGGAYYDALAIFPGKEAG